MSEMREWGSGRAYTLLGVGAVLGVLGTLAFSAGWVLGLSYLLGVTLAGALMSRHGTVGGRRAGGRLGHLEHDR